MTAPDRSTHVVRRFASGVRHPKQWITDLCGGEAAYPLIILFGLNAVDELDRTAFGILLPEIRESFDINISTALSIVALSSIAALALQVPIAQYADKSKRIPLVVVGALAWATFSGMTGLATGLILLTIARSGSSLGKAVIDPTHNSLIADYYPIETRSRVYSFHRAANAVGAFVGPLSAGMLAYYFGWRVPFVVFVVPTVIFAVLALRMKEPTRGRWERQATGASQDIIDTEEESPSFAESWRTAHKVQSLQRIWWSLPFLATSLIGFVTLAALLYDQKFGLDERGRGVAAAVAEPFALVGLVIGARIATRRFVGNVKGLIRFVATVALLTSFASAGFAFAPNIYIAVALNCVISASLAIIGPGVLAALSLAIPPRARATGFAIGSLWVIPGLFVLPVIGWIADSWSIEIGMLVMIPMFVIGSLMLRSVADVIDEDIAQVWQSAAARSEVLYDRRQGTTSLLLLKGVEAGYENRTVLHGIDLRLDEGEVVALLGTNGAGKSTLLKSISGIVEADRGAIVLDGRDITHAPPNEIAALGIVQMPGGQGVFGSLTVEENLELAGWTNRRDPAGVEAATAEVLEMFPVLADRLDSPGSEPVGRPAADAGTRDELRDATEGPADRRAVARPRTGRRRPAPADRAAHGRRRCDRRARRTECQRRPHGRRTCLLHGARHDPVRRPDRRTARTTRPTALGVPVRRPLQRGHGCRRRRGQRPGTRRPARPGADRPHRRARAVGARRVGHLRWDPSRRRHVVRCLAPRDRRCDRPQRRRQDHRLRPDLGFHTARRRPDRARRPQHHVADLLGPRRDGARAVVPGRASLPRADGRRDPGDRAGALHR
jgi:MFS family permease